MTNREGGAGGGREDADIVIVATALTGSVSSAAELGDPTFESLVNSVPAIIHDQIEITVATSFRQAASDGTTHWAPRSITLIEIVKAPSPTLPDTYLYAFRYVVSVGFDAPTVGCDRVDVPRAAAAR